MNRLLVIWGLIVFAFSGVAAGAENIFDFFESEAEAMQIVTMSRLPLSTRRAPATVYVITSEDLEATGAQTLWDALRQVPGVDVMTTRTFYGEVSIRGLNRPLNSRTLVLVDGKTELNGPFDTAYWEAIPVPFTQIDRIEIVVGPASALYGANAINGVINIISKTPEQTKGGKIQYRVGEHRTHLLDAVLGKQKGQATFVGGGSFRTANRFSNGDLRASEVSIFNGQLKYNMSGKSQLGLSMGFTDHSTEFSLGGGGLGIAEGTAGFLRADYRMSKRKVSVFWSRLRPYMRDSYSTAEADPFTFTDRWDVSVEESFLLHSKWDMVLGGNLRRSGTRSNVYDVEQVTQYQGSLFLETAWRANANWTFIGSSRLDWHEMSGWVASPRGSLVFSPAPAHVFRFSFGRAFREPTVTERYVHFAPLFPAPSGFPPVTLTAAGDVDLKREEMVLLELAHTGKFGALSLQSVGFYYRLKNMIANPSLVLVPEALPDLHIRTVFTNAVDPVRAWGGEISGEYRLGSSLQLLATYSLQDIQGVSDFQTPLNGGPRHKINGGIRFKQAGLMVNLQAHWVDETLWEAIDFATFQMIEKTLPGYLLMNVNVGYTFLDSQLRISAGVFNLTNHAHYELDPGRGTQTGLSSEIVKRRAVVGLSYAF